MALVWRLLGIDGKGWVRWESLDSGVYWERVRGAGCALDSWIGERLAVDRRSNTRGYRDGYVC